MLNVVFDVQKKLYNLPKLGGGGGEVIWAMPERNRFFLCEVVPNVIVHRSKVRNLENDEEEVCQTGKR